MNDKPKSIRDKSRPASRWFRGWLVLLMATFLIVFVVWLASNWPRHSSDWLPAIRFAAILSVIVATAFIGLWAFFRWLCCWRNFKRFLFGVACFAALIALFYAEEDWRGKHDWEKFKRQWEARGEHFSFASLSPPSVPDNQNFAMAPIWVESIKAVLGPTNSLQWFGSFAENGRTNFVDRLYMPITHGLDTGPTNGGGDWREATITDLKPWQDYYRSLAAKTNLFPVTPEPQTPAKDVLFALSKYDPAIEKLRQASRRPYSRFPIYSHPDRPFDTLLPHLATLKRCTQVLQLRAIAELQNGQSDKALDDVKLMLRLTDSIRTEPILISHLVRIAMLQVTLQPIYEGLAEHKWSDAQLAEIGSELARLDFLADYELVMRGERACGMSAVDYLRQTRDLSVLTGPNSHNLGLLFRCIPGGWFYQNELRVARFYQNWYLPLVNEKERTVSPSAVQGVEEARGSELRHLTPENFLEPMLLPALGAAAKRFAWAQESTDLARVAIALERYRLAHGEYPESLDVLTPQFMKKIPHDIITSQPSQGSGPASQPLHYRRTSDGRFVLYSVGWNETDDGGAVSFNKGGSVNINQGDWVWRYPAR